MRIAVAIATRGRPAGLVGVVMALWRLRSGSHAIEFVLGVDDDDPTVDEAVAVLATESVPLHIDVGPRGETRGHIVNRMMPRCAEADVVTLLTDWTFPLTWAWDDVLAQGAQQFPRRLTWWSCPYIAGCVTPAIPRAWLAACDFRPSPEIFPFWWDDTWLEEVDAMLAGSEPCLKLPASFAGTHGKTTRGRDFAFWARVFSATRPLRVAQADRMAERLGFASPVSIAPGLADRFAANDRMQLERSGEFERVFGDGAAPTESYLRAKSAALRLIDPPADAAA